MKTLRADKRIETIVKMIPVSECLADIGCDHGKTSVLAIINGKAKRVIASDISQPSLSKAVRLARQYDLSEQIDFRVGNGLSVLKKNEADTIVIAGVGGELMVRILSDGKEMLSIHPNLVLAPNNREAMVREWMMHNQYSSQAEKLVKQNGKFYQVISAVRGKPEELSPIEKEIGRQILSYKTTELIEYLGHKLNQANRAMRGIANSPGNMKTYQVFNDRKMQYQEALAWLKSQKS